MASSTHTGVAVHPTYPPPGQHPGTYGTASVVIGQPQQHYASSPKYKYNPSYSRVSSILFGFLQIILCIFSIAGAIMVETYNGSGDELGTGFWCGTIYAVAGCLAAVAGWYAPRNMIIAVAVLSFLDIPFGIAAVVLATNGLLEDGECWDNTCIVRNVHAMAGNAMIFATGFWEIVFGLCLLIISIRAIRIGSKPQVSSVPVYYTSSAPETVQLNATTSLHAHVTYPQTNNGALQRPQTTTEENLYEIPVQNQF